VKKYEASDLIADLKRSERSADRIDNATCSDVCFEELSNYTNGLQTNTSIGIYPGGKVVARIEPVDFENICPIYARTLPCLKKCKDEDAEKLIVGFSGMTYLCVDNYKNVKQHYKCVEESLNENPRVDTCVTDCLENITKTKASPVKGESETQQDCSSVRCLFKCSFQIVKKTCKPDAIKISREYAKTQLDIIEKTNEKGTKWPKDCTELQKQLASDKPLV